MHPHTANQLWHHASFIFSPEYMNINCTVHKCNIPCLWLQWYTWWYDYYTISENGQCFQAGPFEDLTLRSSSIVWQQLKPDRAEPIKAPAKVFCSSSLFPKANICVKTCIHTDTKGQWDRWISDYKWNMLWSAVLLCDNTCLRSVIAVLLVQWKNTLAHSSFTSWTALNEMWATCFPRDNNLYFPPVIFE